jgi:hypothetical protein
MATWTAIAGDLNVNDIGYDKTFGSNHKDYCFLECDTTQSGKYPLLFQRNISKQLLHCVASFQNAKNLCWKYI